MISKNQECPEHNMGMGMGMGMGTDMVTNLENPNRLH